MVQAVVFGYKRYILVDNSRVLTNKRFANLKNFAKINSQNCNFVNLFYLLKIGIALCLANPLNWE